MKNKDNLKKQNKNMVSKIISSRLSAGKLLSYLFLLTILLPAFSKSLAQAPHGFNYQAVLRDSNGEVKQNENVNIAVELIQNTIDGPVVFNEIHTTQTNAFGLVNLHVGSENGEDFENVDWSAGPYFVRISVNGIAMGTSPLLSVPYALYAESGGDPGTMHWTDGAGQVTTDVNVGIGSENPTAQLHVQGMGDGEGNVLFEGEIKTEPGNPPATGDGTRMMWYPDKAAFRAGRVTGTGAANWNKDSIGNFSFAVGLNTRASGSNSVAMGQLSNASGNFSTAMNWNTTASGNQSVAMGNVTIASGNRSTAMGSHTSAPSFTEAAIGSYNTLYTPSSVSSWNNDDRLFVIGNGTSATNRSDAFMILKNGNTGIGGPANNQLELVVHFSGTSQNLQFTSFDVDPVIHANIDNFGRLGLADRRWWRAYVDTYFGFNTSIQSISDQRYKRNIRPMDNSISKLMQLNPVNYDLIPEKLSPGTEAGTRYKENDLNNQMGFLAQDVQKIFPQLVKPLDDDSNVLTLGYSGLIPVMIKGMQEQQEIINNQQILIDELINRIEKLENDR